MSVCAAGRGEVARGGEDRVLRVPGVGEPVAVRVDAPAHPGGRHELHPADRAGRARAHVAAEVRLDLVDRREHLPRDPVGRAGVLPEPRRAAAYESCCPASGTAEGTSTAPGAFGTRARVATGSDAGARRVRDDGEDVGARRARGERRHEGREDERGGVTAAGRRGARAAAPRRSTTGSRLGQRPCSSASGSGSPARLALEACSSATRKSCLFVAASAAISRVDLAGEHELDQRLR